MENDEASEFAHNWGEMDKDAPEAEHSAKRLAVMNQDWDQVSHRQGSHDISKYDISK